jgi:hypothetical protein
MPLFLKEAPPTSEDFLSSAPGGNLRGLKCVVFLRLLPKLFEDSNFFINKFEQEPRRNWSWELSSGKGSLF